MEIRGVSGAGNPGEFVPKKAEKSADVRPSLGHMSGGCKAATPEQIARNIKSLGNGVLPKALETVVGAVNRKPLNTIGLGLSIPPANLIELSTQILKGIAHEA